MHTPPSSPLLPFTDSSQHHHGTPPPLLWPTSPAGSTHLGEDALRGLVGLDDDVAVESIGVHAQQLVEGVALVVVEVHGDVDRQAEEARPEAAGGGGEGGQGGGDQVSAHPGCVQGMPHGRQREGGTQPASQL